MSWKDDSVYRLYGQFVGQGEDKVLLFSLDEPDITKTRTQVVIPEKSDDELSKEKDIDSEEIIITEKVRVFPAKWSGNFGMPVKCIGAVNTLKRVRYSKDWDVLRPAKEVTELNTISAEQLSGMLIEAKTIMEGWATNNGPDGANQSA